MEKEVLFEGNARSSLKRGVDLLANAVKVTLGAKGRFVVLRKNGRVHPTKDGVTVAKEVNAVDPTEQLGVELTRQSAERAASESGDGTTTATVLTQAIVEEGFKIVNSGVNPVKLVKGIELGKNTVVDFLDTDATPVYPGSVQLQDVATISSNGDDEVVKLVMDAYSKVGDKGIVSVEFAKNSETTMEYVEGVEVEKGYLSNYFITNPATKEAVLNNPLVLVYDDKIHSFAHELVPILDQVADQGREILIVANDIEPQVVATLAANKLRGLIKVIAIKAPNFGELNYEVLQDIAISTGATLISKKAGMSLQEATLEDLGECSKVISTMNKTSIIQGKHDELTFFDYVRDLEVLAKEDQYAKERLARLRGGVALIKVGGIIEAEVLERKDRYDDTVAAVRSAMEEGVVVGGGVSLLKASESLHNIKTGDYEVDLGIEILRKSLAYPMKCMVNNSGANGEVIVQTLLRENGRELWLGKGYDVLENQICDLQTKGILDPKKVTRVALESAVSVASIILTTDCTIAEY